MRKLYWTALKDQLPTVIGTILRQAIGAYVLYLICSHVSMPAAFAWTYWFLVGTDRE